MKLRDLLKGFPSTLLSQLQPADLDHEISDVTSDSREVKSGSVFVAVKGETTDGHEFVDQAGKSAALVVGESEKPAGFAKPYLQVASSRLTLAKIAANFHGNPSHRMVMVGITGTSGKTTTSYLVESILKSAGHKVGVIGTVNFRFGEKIYPSTHTTPGAVELQRLLAQMKSDGCTAVVMEVSSHALKQHRVAFIGFDGAVFTNLSPEHLDYHRDMQDYYSSKAILFKGSVRYAFEAGKKAFAVVNADDFYGEKLRRELMARLDTRFRVMGVSMGEEDFKFTASGITGEVNGVRVDSQLRGKFNAYNILCALAVGLGLGLDKDAIARGITSLKSVPGRLEPVSNDRGITVLVDYAHKPDALEKVLRTLGEIRDGHRLITVFGCGGDRDRVKRPVMGKLAAELSDLVYVTSDNPRTEKPDEIIREIMAGTTGFKNLTIESDRAKAIGLAIKEAKRGDIVLIAGKGHEDYQIIGETKIHFDDREVAARALN